MEPQALFFRSFFGLEAVLTSKSASARKMMQNGGVIMPIALSSFENEHVCVFNASKVFLLKKNEGSIILKGGNQLASQSIR